MYQPLVSVIIPVYNTENFIKDCMDSLICQTLKNIEIICVDDGSTDSSVDILLDYAKKDNRVKVFQQKNSGAGTARNTGLNYATGKYLSFLDADDFYEPDMLEKACSRIISTDSEVVVFGSDIYFDEDKKYKILDYSINKSLLPPNSPFAGTDVKKDIFKLFVGWAWDKLFKSSFIEENNLKFQEQRTTNDMLFVFSAIAKAEKIITMDDVFVHHRSSQGSLSVTREKSWHCFYDALTALKNQLLEWNLYERFQQDYINYCVHFSLWNLNTLAEPEKTVLHNKLREEWFDAMMVTSFDKNYFYNLYEYSQFINIMAPEGECFIPDYRIKMLYLCEKMKYLQAMVRTKGVLYTLRFLRERI